MSNKSQYSENLPLSEKVIYVLNLFETAKVENIASEIAELDGIAAEEAVGRLHIEVEEQVKDLESKGIIQRKSTNSQHFSLNDRFTK